MRALIRRLLITKEHQEPAAFAPDELSPRVHRLEIQIRELQDRYESLEGRHASLSASVRGRLGGRPARSANVIPPYSNNLPI